MASLWAWRFLSEDRRLSQQSDQHIAEPQHRFYTSNVQNAMIQGLWGCTNLGDALRHGHGLVACRIQLDGVVRQRRHTITDATALTVVAIVDSTHALNQCTCDIVERYLHQMREIGRELDPRLWNAVETQRAWLAGAVTEREQQEAANRALHVWYEAHAHEIALSVDQRAARAEEVQIVGVSRTIVAWLGAQMYITTAKAMHTFLARHPQERRATRGLEERLLANLDAKASANASMEG